MRFVLCLLSILFFIPAALSLNNGLALKPPMGWDPWNGFHENFTEDVFYQTADLMHSNGMQDLGYEFINIDGGWWKGVDTGKVQRNATGYLQEDPTKFPNGIPALVNYLHSLNFKSGHYTSSGTQFCNSAHDQPASQGYEPQDANLFISWGADLVKLDACGQQIDVLALVYTWRALLNASGRPILFANCQNDCQTDSGNNVYTWQDWCPDQSNMWRTSKDLKPNWNSVMNNLNSLVGRGSYGAPGRWNDPDSLVVGVANFTVDENTAHFSLWCITSAPLILGNDLRNMSSDIENIITNKEAIAVNQDYKNTAGDRVSLNGDAQVWGKNLTDGVAAVLLNTNNSTTTTVVAKWIDLGIPLNQTCQVRDLWKHADVGLFSGNFTALVDPHAVFFIKIYQCQT